MGEWVLLTLSCFVFYLHVKQRNYSLVAAFLMELAWCVYSLYFGDYAQALFFLGYSALTVRTLLT